MKLSRLEYETLPEGTNLFLETLVLLHAFECKDHKKKKKKKNQMVGCCGRLLQISLWERRKIVSRDDRVTRYDSAVFPVCLM